MNEKRLLANIPLVGYILDQRQVPFVERSIDATWAYEGVISSVPTGFNPFGGKVYYAENSWLSKVLNGGPLPSTHKDQQWLMYELAFLCHDYLHMWAISEIILYCKKCINIDIEHSFSAFDLEFLYLISETVATIGFDYWFLAQVNVSEYCPLNTNFKTLTTSYSLEYDQIIKFVNPSLKVHSKKFFNWLNHGYLYGEFIGFAVDDIIEYPLQLQWIADEVKMANKQRVFIDLWLSYSGLQKNKKESSQIKPLHKRKIAAHLREKLWEIVNLRDIPLVSPYCLDQLRVGVNDFDFRFINIGALGRAKDVYMSYADECDEEQFRYLSLQCIIAHYYDPKLAKRNIEELVVQGRRKEISKIVQSLEEIPAKNNNEDLILTFIN